MKLHLELQRGGRLAWLMIALLALGVGATTVLFSVVNGVLLRPLALHDPGRLVLLGERVPQIPGSDKFLYLDNPAAIAAWRKEATDFSGLAVIKSNIFTLANGGEPQLLWGANVSPNFFDVAEVHPALGRGLVAADENGTTHPMVITDRLWRAAFHGDPAVIGRQVGLPGSEARIVGVLPAWFHLDGRELGPMLGTHACDFLMALHIPPQEFQSGVFTDFNYEVMGRLRPGVSQQQALAQLNGIQANLARTAPEKLSLYGAITPLRDFAVAGTRQALWLLLAGVLALLAIVCVNLAGLWLTRLADRRRDWAIRTALGATPERLAASMLMEILAMSLCGGALGVGCAALGLHALLAAAPADLPRLNEVQLDWRVFAFGLGLSLVAGVLTGLPPALRLLRADPQEALKAGAAATTADPASLRSRQLLLGVQAGLATLLLAAVGLLGLSFYRILSQPSGFTAEHAIAADIALVGYTDRQRIQLQRQLPEAVRAVAGVEAAGFTSYLPLEGETWIDSAGVPGRVVAPGQELHINVRFISSGYLSAIGIPLLAGRDLAESDLPAGWPPKDDAAEGAMHEAVVISHATAQALWPGETPSAIMGRKILVNGDLTPIVVGVAADARATLTEAAPPTVYQPYWAYPPYRFSMVVRTALPEEAIAGALRSAIWRVAPAAPVPALRPLDAVKAEAVSTQRYQLMLLLLFAAASLALAGLGVFALVSHSVARRARELAIRLTLGAPPAEVWRRVVMQALAPVTAGVGLGWIAAFGARQLLADQLFEVNAGNPAVLAAAGVAVAVTAFAGCLLPARRATRTDPLSALRAE